MSRVWSKAIPVHAFGLKGPPKVPTARGFDRFGTVVIGPSLVFPFGNVAQGHRLCAGRTAAFFHLRLATRAFNGGGCTFKLEVVEELHLVSFSFSLLLVLRVR